ncbi:MAG: S-methyl-5-thioribose-1-phosphate isomerase [Thermoguttaceae bacterium]|nr:S-methyl-5-thioribose-1-phosphate isomerase [Thermoguttaceae bacterium]
MSDRISYETLSWESPAGASAVDELRGGRLTLIDQTRLPAEFLRMTCETPEDVWRAIKRLSVRGAPAIGIAAAYGVCLGIQSLFAGADRPTRGELLAAVEKTAAYLATSRPTAVNLFWALDRMKARAAAEKDAAAEEIAVALMTEAKTIHDEDRELCRRIGRHGAGLVKDGDVLLTHCNAGALATADYGTALGVFYAAQEEGKNIRVYADETRPLLQGARLTAWELAVHGIDVTLICDSMAAMLMRQKKIDAVFVGADRIAANGDVANKIGTYGVAVSARAHGVPFYVAAPFSTFDLTLSDGSQIPIEERDPEEIRRGFGRQTAPDGIKIYNPAFDVTPAELISGIVTEKGVIAPVTADEIRRFIQTE